jgi:maltose-binding protein MalE
LTVWKRVKRLEDDLKEIKSDLKSLLQNSSEIKGKIDGLPSAYEFGQLKGRVDTLPTMAKISALVAFAVGILSVISKWSEIRDFLI